MRIGIPSLARFDRDLLPENLNSLGVDLSNMPVATPEIVKSALQNLPVNMQKISFPDLGPLGTSGMSVFEGDPITIASGSTSPMSPMVEPEATLMDVDKIIEAAVEAAVGNGQPTMDDTILNTNDLGEQLPLGTDNEIDISQFLRSREETLKTLQEMFGPQVQYATPTTATTDDGGMFGGGTSPDPAGVGFFKKQDAMPTTTETQQPDFMTQLNELIASMQAEQTAAAEQAAAAEAERQKQVAEMTQNYMVGQPAVGYNPYESGQYQNNPYGAAGVPAMGGITTIPVPAAYNPNPYPIGGMT